MHTVHVNDQNWLFEPVCLEFVSNSRKGREFKKDAETFSVNKTVELGKQMGINPMQTRIQARIKD